MLLLLLIDIIGISFFLLEYLHLYGYIRGYNSVGVKEKSPNMDPQNTSALPTGDWHVSDHN